MNIVPANLAKQHNEFFTGSHSTTNRDRLLTPGQQKLVYLFKLGAFGNDFTEGRGRKALDAGCGAAFNTITLSMLGWDTYGFEITSEILNNAKRNVAAYRQKAVLKIGTNQNIPYPANEFSMLLSMNSIHYVDSESEVEKAIAEYARVLVPGGKIYLSTTHPENWILEGAKTDGSSIFVIDKAGDYRNGLSMYCFGSEEKLKKKFEPYFKNIRIGIDKQELFVKTIINYVMTGEVR